MPASLTTISGILKEIYEPGVRDQLNSKVKTLMRITKTDAHIESTTGGKYVTFPLHTKRNTGIGARRENETLPTSGNQTVVDARIGLKYQYGAVGLSGPTMDLAESNYQAFVSAIELELNGLKTDLAVDLNRQVYGDASGTVATVSTVGATVTPTITSGILSLQEGELVDVYTAANLAADSTAKNTGIVVNSISVSANTATFDTSVTWAAGDCIVRTGSANREWTGFKAIVAATGVLYNVDPATTGQWKSYVDSNGGTTRAVSESRMINASDQVVAACGEQPSVIFTSLGVRRSYFNLLSQLRQVVNTTEYTGGFKGLAFTTDDGEIPVVSDKDSPPNQMIGLNESHIKVYREHDWKFMDRDGNMWLRSPTKDAYSATMTQYSELGTDQRNSHFIIKDLIES